MGKVKARKITTDLVREDIQFFPLPSRDLVTVRQEVIDGNVKTEPRVDDVPKNSIVKIEQRYRAGEESLANEALESLVSKLKLKVLFIRPPDRIVIRESRKRMEEMKDNLDPMSALEVWLRMKPSKNIEQEVITARARIFLDKLDGKDFHRKVPEGFFLSGLMVSNWMPFKDNWVIDGLKDGLIGIVGQYEGQGGRSNRSGKSAIFDAIRFALFGQGRAVKATDELIHAGSDRLEVGVALQFDSGKSAVIQRSFGGQTEIVIDGGSRKVKEAADEISQMLGMNEEDFSRTCFVRQGDLERILTQQSAQLKADVVRWRGLDIWPALDNLVLSEESATNKQRLLVDARKKVALETVTKGEPSREEIERLESAIEKIESKRESFASAKLKVDRLRRELSISQRVLDLKKSLEPKEELSKSRKKFESSMEKKKEAIVSARTAEGMKREEYEKAKALVKEGFDGVCPIDGCACPRKDEINEGTDEGEKRLREAQAILNKAIESRRAAEQELAEVKKDADRIDSKLKEIAVAERTIQEIGSVRSVNALRAELEEAQEEIAGAGIDDGALKELKSRLTNMLALEKMYAESKAILAECEEQLESFQRELRILHYLRFAFGKSGISSMMIENALEEIEGQVNYVLEQLGTDHRLKFDPERALKRLSRSCFECGATFEEGSKEKFCPECGAVRQNERSDELRPMIVENGRKQAFELDSGAGRALVALATRAAMSRFLGASVLFLDEISGALDDYHLTLLIRLLHKLPSMGFKQIFVISHQKEVDATAPVQIVVNRIQEEGRSTVTI